MAWKIFVLSLDDDVGRRAALAGVLEESGLGFEVFPAVDGRNGLSPEWDAQVDRKAAAARNKYMPSDVEFACALSHREILKKIIADGLEGAIVLEDDCVLADLFADFVRSGVYQSLPMVLLYHGSARVFRFSERSLMAGVQAHRISINPWGTVGYTISRVAAEHLVKRATPVTGFADWPCSLSEIGALATIPMLVGHQRRGEAHSHIVESRKNRTRNPPSSRLAYLASFASIRSFASKNLRRLVSIRVTERIR